MTEENKPFPTGWNGKLKYKPGFKDMEETILQFDRKNIFDHNTEEFKNNYTAHILFRKEYGDNAKRPKRVPNSFMMMKSVVKLIADDKRINCQDGKYLSQMCGIIWKGANPEEKYKYRLMALEFGRYHKQKFPHYKYSPPKRSLKNRGTIFEIKTPEYYQPSFPHQMNEVTIQNDLVDSTFSQQLDDQMGENQASTFPHGLDEMCENSVNSLMLINGIFFQSYQQEPTIAVNCAPLELELDPNAGQAPIVGNNHPLNPSSTFGNGGMNMQYFNLKK